MTRRSSVLPVTVYGTALARPAAPHRPPGDRRMDRRVHLDGALGRPLRLPAPHAAATPPLLHMTVCVEGLVSKVELNGLTGMAQSFDPETGRYTVQFEQRDSVVAIKGGNLKLVED